MTKHKSFMYVFTVSAHFNYDINNKHLINLCVASFCFVSFNSNVESIGISCFVPFMEWTEHARERGKHKDGAMQWTFIVDDDVV